MKKDIIVNKNNPLTRNYVPNNLVLYENNYANHLDENHKILVDQEVLDNFVLMSEDAYEEGYLIIIDSAYRSYEYQENLLRKYVQKYGESAYFRVANPGMSEHQTGLAIDIAVINNNKYIEKLSDKISEMNWLFQNANKYGFILRYPIDKEGITGFNYEPWHFRYVGKKLANIMYNKNITLEEYYLEYKELVTI